MTRTVELDITGPDADASPPDGPTGRPGAAGAGLVFSARTRLLDSASVGAVGVLAVALTWLVPESREGYVVAHALPAIPLLAASFVWAGRVRRRGAPEYAAFWRHWRCACACGLGAAIAGTAMPAWPPLLGVDLALMVAAVPFWAAAGRQALTIPAGRLDPAVDMVDGLTAIVVLGAPGVLLLAEALLGNAVPAAALPLGVLPGHRARRPVRRGAEHRTGAARGAPGPRARHRPGRDVLRQRRAGSSSAWSRGSTSRSAPSSPPTSPTSSWWRRCLVVAPRRVRRPGRLPVERQVRRRNPMGLLSTVVLSVLAAYVLGWRRDDAWAVVYLVGLLLTVVALSAVRQTMLTRDTRRLAGELARMAEERRCLLAGHGAAVEDDRRRIVSELHAQAVGSLSTLGHRRADGVRSLPAPTAWRSASRRPGPGRPQPARRGAAHPPRRPPVRSVRSTAPATTPSGSARVPTPPISATPCRRGSTSGGGRRDHRARA